MRRIANWPERWLKAALDGGANFFDAADAYGPNINEIQNQEALSPFYDNLGDRKWDPVLDYTATRNLAFIPWFPLASVSEKIPK